MCDKCETEEDYIDTHGFGVSSRSLYSNEPIVINIETWEQNKFMLKVFNVDYDSLKWYKKAELRFDFTFGQLKNKILKR